MKKRLAMMLAICMMMSAVTGCGSSSSATEAPATTAPAATEAVTEAPETEAPETEAAEGAVTITDMSGDEVTVEGAVEDVVVLWPSVTSSFFVMGAGDLVSALSMNQPATMNSWTRFFYPGAPEIPAMGGITPAVEEVIALDPDFVIVHPSSAKDGYAAQMREAGIPAANLSFNNYETMKQAYTAIGEVLGGEYKEKLTNWCADVDALMAKNAEITADLAEEDKPVVYYIAGQSDSLTTTMGQGSIMQEWTESCGGIYAPAAMDVENQEVTEEAVFAANPDVIIVGGAYQHILMEKLQNTDGWKDLDAVKNGRVYNNPYGCFNWERFGLESKLQLEYAMMCIQPELAEANGINREYMIDQVIAFYETNNGTVLTEEQAGFMMDGLTSEGTEEITAE